MRWLALTAALLLLTLPTAAIRADDGTATTVGVDDPTYVGDPPPCGTTGEATLSVIDCVGVDQVPSLDETASPGGATAGAAAAATPVFDPGLPPDCRIHLQAIFYAETDWLRLGQKLAADPSPCSDYYISIPPLSNDKTHFRVLQDDLIRALGPRFHPVAEINISGNTGWADWVRTNHKTWTEAGIEARRRMAVAGYDVASGETWAINELSSAVRRNTGAARANMAELIHALHDADGTLPAAQGIVFVIGIDQDLADVSTYKATMESWLQDNGFWGEMTRDVRWWSQEAYPNSFNWGVAGAPRAIRAEHFNDYLQHPLTLAEAGPASVRTARDFLEHSYTALTSSAWRWPSAFGNTDISQEQMDDFVSEEIFSVRHYVGSHPQSIPQGFFGTAWAPLKPAAVSNSDFATQTALILERLASGLHYSYSQGGSSQEGACGVPGDHAFCDEDVAGAAFNDAWKQFSDW
jgi:hypothetical protein